MVTGYFARELRGLFVIWAAREGYRGTLPCAEGSRCPHKNDIVHPNSAKPPRRVNAATAPLH